MVDGPLEDGDDGLFARESASGLELSQLEGGNELTSSGSGSPSTEAPPLGTSRSMPLARGGYRRRDSFRTANM